MTCSLSGKWMSTSSRRYLQVNHLHLEGHLQKLCSKHSYQWQGEEMSSPRCCLPKGSYLDKLRCSFIQEIIGRQSRCERDVVLCSQHFCCLEMSLQWVRGARSTGTKSHSPKLSNCGWIILTRLTLQDKGFFFSQVQISEKILTCPATGPDRLRRAGKDCVSRFVSN